ncbi:TIGR04290 family methyltransferase [Ramlibacter tataouinensis]|uniref:3-demethylubiquinone-9 3-methyltransferase (3,4-dihydroxy-5-hexaprenylbenzoate methyltransferase)-like protein n=1 Tax=Ramlibacter tataouinensis (strain ATCC BAA-407 / DSM 14655 / LMG 21543 / TTB310) TaxID=365046 RepID=F5Y5J1_RAMTT|nr:TIGR04290 family methyltransferase [Ramlibacter tataouinensis]AEG92687.1 3-demethylubiquinone-9 3-methyltransferase (3,4-dihydroxy-5-hexaprenylbenzoate methyltransferase)-like protein [Ramlibacter tataouinensis TTB310]
MSARETADAALAAPQAEADELQRQIDALGPWFHNLHLPGGVQTVPRHFLGGDFPRFKWLEIAPHIPEDLGGWRVLDVGCNAGFYSFELARRGADVVAIDHEPLYLEQARWAARQFGLQDRIEFREQGVYDLLGWGEERFDLVWFMGVFYHLRYPLLALDTLARMTRRLMVFQTLTLPGEAVYEDTADHPITEREPLLHEGWPKMAFIEHRFSGDETNWWVANHAGCEAMLRSAGLRVVGRPAGEIYLCEPQAPDRAGAMQWDAVKAVIRR